MLSSSLHVFFLAMLPVTELRAALPLALTVYDLPVVWAFVASVLGNLVPIAFVYVLLEPLLGFTERRIPLLHTIMQKYFHALKIKHRDAFDRYGSVALLLFVAVPLPGTGVWTASVLALLFGVDKRYGIPAISIGLLLAGLIVLAITQGGIGVFGAD